MQLPLFDLDRHEGLPAIDQLVERGALFVVNHSAGKDSQAMLHVVRQRVPDDQILVIHAHLPEVEWQGTINHINAEILVSQPRPSP